MATARGVGGRAALAWTWRGRSSPTLGPPIVLLSGLYALALALGIATLLTPPRLVLVLGTSGTGAVRVAWDQPASNLWDRGVRWGDQVLALTCIKLILPRRAQGGVDRCLGAFCGG